MKKRSISNGEVAKTALNHDAIIITFDRDFTILRRDLKMQSMIIYIKIHPRDPAVAKKLLETYLDQCIKKLIKPSIIELTTDGITTIPT